MNDVEGNKEMAAARSSNTGTHFICRPDVLLHVGTLQSIIARRRHAMSAIDDGFTAPGGVEGGRHTAGRRASCLQAAAMRLGG